MTCEAFLGPRLRPVALVVVGSLFFGHCSQPPAFQSEPVLGANPNPSAPQAAVLTFERTAPATTLVDVTDGEKSWRLEFGPERDPAEGLPIVGMRPARKHEVRVALRAANGAEIPATGILEFTPPALPEVGVDFPPVQVQASRPAEMEPGVTLFNPRRRKVGRGPDIAAFNAGFGMLMALDAAGEVVWYFRTDSRISDFEKLSNGNLIFVTADFRLVEIDWLGNTVRQWYAKRRPEGPAEGTAVDAQTFHHEIDELPNGNILVLSTEWKEIDNYYTDEYDENAPRKRQKVMGDVIVEFEPDTGEVVWEWKAFDHLDPFRIGYETFSNYWIRRGFPETVDWSHANNLLYDASDDSILVNFRYQAAAVKIDRQTKEIRWIFGEPSGWGELSPRVLKADGDLQWPYHQHSPHPTPHGTLLVFDNGNYQARPFRKPKAVQETFSRAVEYAIDERGMTARQIWESERMGPERVVAIAMGDVDWLPETGNVLVAYGALLDPDSFGKVQWQSSSRQQFNQWTRLREYKRSEPAEVVYEVILDGGESDIGWTLFGAERIDRVGR